MLHAIIDRGADAVVTGRAAGMDVVTRSLDACTHVAQTVRRCCRHEPLPRRPLMVVATAVIGGCALGLGVARTCPAGAARHVVVGCGCLALALFVAWMVAFRAARHRLSAGVLIAAIAVACGGWAIARDRLFRADDLAWSLDETPSPVAIEGIVVEAPRRLPPPAGAPTGPAPEPVSECVVAVRGVRSGATWKPAGGRAAVVVAGVLPDIVSGSRVRILGRGFRPAHPLNPGEFDFRDRARAQRCLSIVRCRSSDALRIIAPPPVWSVAAWLDRIRASGARTLAEHLRDRSGLATALLLGTREALPGDEARAFLVTGTIHILSISGLHVGILATGLFRVLRLAAVRRSHALLVVAVSTGLYMVLVGAETPVVRATLLVWLSCLGAALGRRSPALNALAVAAIIVLVWHPPELLRIGTQLSFLSTAVLVGAGALAPLHAASDDPIERLIESSRTPEERRVRRFGRRLAGAVITGTAIWAVTAPIVAARFHVVSPIGLVLNPLVAPLVPLAMAWGMLCLVMAPVSTLLSGACGAACDATLAIVEWLIDRAAAVPGAYAWVVGPAEWWVVGAYAWLLALLLVLPRERLVRVGTWALAAAVWSGIGLAASAVVSAAGGQRVGFDVTVAALGHGCGVVVRSPSGKVLVYDAGRLGAPGAARRAMAGVLWTSGIARIDTLVVSHADADHFNAVPDLLERFVVGRLVVSRTFLGSDAPAAHELLRAVHERHIPVACVEAGDEIPFDPSCRVRVLHHEAAAREDNQTSLVVGVEAAGRRLLLTGDLEGESLSRFVAADPDRCDVLLAPHHGSITSLPADVAAATQPAWVVVSGPGGRGWEQVRRAYATAAGTDRPAHVVKTGGDEGGSGAVRLSLSAAHVAVSQFREGRWRDVRPPRPFRAATATPLPPATRRSG